jgi:hypothetical protein
MSFPATQEEGVLPPPVDDEHLLTTPREFSEVGSVEKLTTEPQSLIAEKAGALMDKRETLPHNLPLRPFETSEHIWPFSRYRDVFYGDNLEETKDEIIPAPKQEIAKEAPIILHVEIPTLETSREESMIKEIVPEKRVEPSMRKEVAEPGPYREPIKLSGGDEKLVVTACVMLLVVLLLLGYMYSNGRL